MYHFDSRIRYSETDENGQLSLTGILNYLQDCTTFQSEDMKRGIPFLWDMHKVWMLAGWQVLIDKRPALGDNVSIFTWPYDFKGIYGLRNFKVTEKAGKTAEEADRPIIRANAVWFLYDLQSGRPCRIPEEVSSAYQLEEKLAMEYAPRRIPLPEPMEAGRELIIGRHQLDSNHHVNNARYVELAAEYLPSGTEVREIRAEYKRAALLGDRICPRALLTQDSLTVSLQDAEGEPYANVYFRL